MKPRLTKPMLAGGICAAAVGVLLTAGAGILLYQRCQQAAPLPRDEQANLDLLAAWQPPGDGAELNDLFPQRIGQLEAKQRGDDATIPEMGLGIRGYRALYEGNSEQLEIFLYRLNVREQEFIANRIQQSLKANFSSYTANSEDLQHGDARLVRLAFSAAPPAQHGLLWQSKGWTILLRTRRENVDLEALMRNYLRAMGGQPPGA